MSPYISIIIWLAVMGVFGYLIPVEFYENRFGRREIRVNGLYAVCVFLPAVIMAAVRKNIGDTYAYEIMYRNIPAAVGALASYLLQNTKDPGFTAISGLIKIIFGGNTVIYFFILAAIQGAALVYIFRRYSINYLLSVFLFIASTDYISWMFNGVRQFTAVCIVFAATPLMLKKKWFPLTIFILLASTVHGSALLMLPVVFIVQGKAWNKRTIGFIAACIAVLAFTDQFTNVLDMLLSDTQYTNVVSDWKSLNDDGTNILRVLVYSVPMILAFLGRKWLDAENDPVINLCINMSIITSGLYIVSAVTSGVYIGRLPIYTSLYGYILLPYVIENVFTKDSARLMKWMMVIIYLVFYYFQIHFAWGLL